MMPIFKYSDPVSFLSDKICSMPNKGYGQAAKLARFLSVHPTLIGQILKKKREISPEHAALIASFFTLPSLESEYFVTLVETQRAGNSELRKLMALRLKRLREQSTRLTQIIKRERSELNEEEKARFYSSWIYSAIRQMSALNESMDLAIFAQQLDLKVDVVHKAMEFLLATGLCKVVRDHYEPGPTFTHIEAESPWVVSHHLNWRQKAIESIAKNPSSQNNLHLSWPMTLSKKDRERVQMMLLELIEKIRKIVPDSPSEDLSCLNIDWFSLIKESS